MSTTFYAQLEPLTDFADVADPRRYVPLPHDWYVLISDVRGSTQAIAEGRYKEVNMVGAASIVAVLNAAPDSDIPFVFGGDGATLAVPADLLPRAGRALLGVQAIARREFGLDLRVGVVPVAAIAREGHEVWVARLAISPEYAQAVFSGGGLAAAERLVKAPGSPFLLAADRAGDRRPAAEDPSQVRPAPGAAPEADLTGLECRWQDIRSRHGETVCLLVMASADQSAERGAQIYREVLAHIRESYGDERDYHPLAIEGLRPSYDPRRLLAETKLRSPLGLAPRLRYLAQIWALNLAVRLYKRLEQLRGRLPFWDQYREIVFRTADYKKYDDTLRMIIAGTPAQRARLTAFLEERYQAGDLVYGLHVTDRALMTCLVFERLGRQVHFVDGADGGYALAAKALKARVEVRGQRSEVTTV